MLYHDVCSFLELNQALTHSSHDILFGCTLQTNCQKHIDECHIVQGFGNKIAAKMKHIHFEIAPKWQKQQGCFDLCQRLRNYGFEIWRGGKIVEGEPGGSIFDVDAIKPRSKK